MKKEILEKSKKTTKSAQSSKNIEKPVRDTIKRDANEVKVLHAKLNRVMGQIGGIKKMLDDGRSCDDILIQLSAVSSVVNTIKFSFIKEIMTTEFSAKIKSDDFSAYDEMLAVIKKYL